MIGVAVNIRVLFLSSLLLVAAPTLAREKTDVIVMNNGDRLREEIKGIDAGVLYLSLDYVDGTISIQWSKVARLESIQRFIVKTQDGSCLAARSLQRRHLQVTDSPEEVVLERSRIIKLDETSEKFQQRLNGAITIGTIYSKGNQSTQFNLSSQIEYLQENSKAGTNFNSSVSGSSGDKTSTRNQVGLSFLHLLPRKNYFCSGLSSFLQSSEQGIGLQTNLGAGIGR